MSTFRTIEYFPGRVRLLDQTRLPLDEVYEDFNSVEAVALAIERMVGRGAPAIGITAAYGIAVAAHTGLAFAAAVARLRKIVLAGEVS